MKLEEGNRREEGKRETVSESQSGKETKTHMQNRHVGHPRRAKRDDHDFWLGGQTLGKASGLEGLSYRSSEKQAADSAFLN